MPPISIVIPAYNEEKDIGACLESLIAQETDEPFEVIVVDNTSTDRTAEIAQSYTDRLNLRVIRESRKGRGAARATGFRSAQGEIIFSTDADTLTPPNWVETLTSALMQNDCVAISGPVRTVDLSASANIFFNAIQPFSMHIYRIFFCSFWLTGSNFAILKNAYEQAGGFDPVLPSQEDTDLTNRIKKIGRIQYVPLPVISSGRRFRGGFLRFVLGLLAYPFGWLLRFVFGKKDVDLQDVR